MKRFLSTGGLTLFIMLFSVVVISAQPTCSALIQEALAEIDNTCEGLERNNACYGFDLVQAAFLNEVPDDYFALPADIAAIADIETIATAGLDEETGTWGVAVMSIQANLPNTIPGQNVTFILMGDTEVENAVDPDEAFIPADGMAVTIITPQGANVRSGPGLNFNVVGGAGQNAILQADGQSEDGQWLRVAYNNRPTWINRVVIAEDEAFDELPILAPELQTTMQAFYLRTGIGQASCEGIPEDILLVQGPNGIDIELQVNGANVVIASTIGLRVLEIDGELFLELIVFSGQAEIDGVTVPLGYSTLLCLGDAANRGLDGEANDRLVSCAPTTPQPVDDFGAIFCYLEEIPASLMSYQIEILCPGETPPPTTSPSNGGNTASDSQLADVNCSEFSLIGPTSGITPRPTVFTWTEATGATRYEIVFYDFTGAFAASYFTDSTSIELNVGQIPTGSELSWEVRAFQGEAYACVTYRTPTIVREADPFAQPSGEGLTVFLRSCGAGAAYAVEGELAWRNLPDGETISATLGDAYGTSAAQTSGAESGSFNLAYNPDGPTVVRATTSDGQSFSFPCT
ncbi:MAG: SH3 domain-containing protein [Anaerolineae bacterium]|nr:SH3 domain-containing protein [Anaerolineae bacterium]MDQ7036686.1 SH3 domain-containing protein [Anaerolineae bacterium]